MLTIKILKTCEDLICSMLYSLYGVSSSTDNTCGRVHRAIEGIIQELKAGGVKE